MLSSEAPVEHRVVVVPLPLGQGTAVGQPVTVTLRPGEGPGQWELSWRPDSHTRWLPSFVGWLVIAPDDRLWLFGRYRVPFGPVGAVFDWLIGRRMATASVGRFVDGLVAHVEAEARELVDRGAIAPTPGVSDLRPL